MTTLSQAAMGVRLWFLTALCCLGWLAGCKTRGMSEESLAFVHPGQTTRAEVIENFGPPHCEVKSSRVVGYVWESVLGKESHIVFQREQGLPVLPTETADWGRAKHAVAFLFDEADQVERCQILPLKAGQPVEKALIEWSGSSHVP
jgi:hypothetical protein